VTRREFLSEQSSAICIFEGRAAPASWTFSKVKSVVHCCGVEEQIGHSSRPNDVNTTHPPKHGARLQMSMLS